MCLKNYFVYFLNFFSLEQETLLIHHPTIFFLCPEYPQDHIFAGESRKALSLLFCCNNTFLGLGTGGEGEGSRGIQKRTLVNISEVSLFNSFLLSLQPSPAEILPVISIKNYLVFLNYNKPSHSNSKYIILELLTKFIFHQ